MKFSWFLALRYLKPKRTFISIITVISIAGVALGVGVLIVVIAVMSGFQKRIKDEWLKVEPPLYLRDDNRTLFAQQGPEQEQEGTVPVWRELLPKIKSYPGVESASPFINVPGLAQRARPRKFQEEIIQVDQLPPDGPPTPEGTAAPEVPAPAPELPEGDGARGPTGKPAVPEKPHPAAKPAANNPPPPEPPVAEPPADPPPVPPSDKTATPADPSVAPDPGTEPPDDYSEEDEEDLRERSRPYTDVILIGLDTDDARLMEKYDKRFTELLNMPMQQAWGEFDVTGLSVVLTENVVAKLFRRAEEAFPEPGMTEYNIFSPDLLHSVLKISQEQSAAKRKAAKAKKLREEKGITPGQDTEAEPEVQEADYPLPEVLTLTGYFTDDKQQSAGQSSIGYVSLKTAQRLSGAGHAVDGIFVDLADPYDAPAMAKKLEESGLLPEGWRTETWVQRHRQQFEAVENEIGMMYIVLGFISLVAAFCIMNTMITMAVQKRREIGMMRALGAKTSHIVSLFMTKGFIVGLFGTGIGYVLGRLVLVFRNDLRTWINSHFGHQIFDSAIYGLNEIPADLRLMDQVLICGIAFVLCTLAAVPPAWMVGRMEPARALRNDR